MKTDDPWAKYRFEQQIAALIEQRRGAVPRGCGWADYDIEAVRGEGYFPDAVAALGFRFQDRESQVVSCNVCGGLFTEQLSVMRRHRLKCGWDA